MSASPNREEVIFDAVIQLPTPEQRAAYLNEACASQPELRRQVEELLAAHDKAGTFLDPPAAETLGVPPSGGSPGQPAKAGTLNATVKLTLPSDEVLGTMIGRYKLLQQIGEGGCGVVYMAEQEEPVRRRVALKVIKLGMDTKQVIARFEAERQVLALMDHPNIAKVLDAGATDAGRPYFVMELVRGIKITDYCDQNNLSTEDRLKLFTQVCQAIQHAHQKGIIHRDIKPSNILIADHDGVPVPKVIDFGIAKATSGQRLTDKTVFTAFEQFIGTPAYMSPEQANLSGLDIDTRTDIYALGVLLYELLTGQTPFDAKDLMAAGLDAMRRIIREQEPARPSTRLSTMLVADLTIVANHRHAEPGRLGTLLRGDLDWIVMKALEKDRTRRYETANGLAMDIQRHLDDEPIVARPASNLYRVQKLVRRNKLAVASATAILLALILGVVVSSWLAVRASQAERKTSEALAQAKLAQAEEAKQRALASQNANAEKAQREKAEASAKKSRDVLNFVQNMFTRASGAYADKVTVLQMLNMGTSGVEERFKDQPDVSSAVQYAIGICYSKIGQWQVAESYLTRSLEMRVEIFGFENTDTLDTARELASVAFSLKQTGLAEALCRKITDSAKLVREKSVNSDKQIEQFRTFELWADRKLLQIFIEDRRFDLARPLFTNLLRAVAADEITGADGGAIWSEAGHLALEEGRPQDALKALDKEETYYRPNGYIVQLAWTHGLRGAVYLAMGEHARAEPLITNELAVLEHRFGNSHFRVQRAYRDLVSLYTKTGNIEKAQEWKRKLDAPVDEVEQANSLALSVQALLSARMFSEAEPLARKCLLIREQKLPNDWRTFNTKSMLGGSLLAQKKYPEAEPLLLSGYEGMKQREDKIPANGKVRLPESIQRLVQLYEATGQSEKAAEWKKKLDLFNSGQAEKKTVTAKEAAK